MRAVLSIALPLALLAAAPAIAQSVTAYDDSWYRAPYWSGEYPNGFTVLKDTTVQLRAVLDPQAERSIACDLKAKSTFQPWNHSRVEEQGLSFTSFTRIAEYQVKEAYRADLFSSEDSSPVSLSLERGDVWRYLAYYAEGMFLIEYKGVKYDADQSLFEVSEQMGDTNGYEEWLRINCPNNRWGWLFMGDIELDNVTFASPNITGYPEAKDLD